VERFEYRISSTLESSAKYGLCEVCGQWVSEVYAQTTFRILPATDAVIAKITGKEAPLEWRVHHSSGFGHEACLIACRRNGSERNPE
ncbi:MAG: hypothetical protein HC933_19980, partial [Pleurocapsa sp. SU_196_0]|nr:hypothetical protein [Pleurocapsa sp. SU_196_0]